MYTKFIIMPKVGQVKVTKAEQSRRMREIALAGKARRKGVGSRVPLEEIPDHCVVISKNRGAKSTGLEVIAPNKSYDSVTKFLDALDAGEVPVVGEEDLGVMDTSVDSGIDKSFEPTETEIQQAECSSSSESEVSSDDEDDLLVTPEEREGFFIADNRSVMDFVDEINVCSSCRTPNCAGISSFFSPSFSKNHGLVVLDFLTKL